MLANTCSKAVLEQPSPSCLAHSALGRRNIVLVQSTSWTFFDPLEAFVPTFTIFAKFQLLCHWFADREYTGCFRHGFVFGVSVVLPAVSPTNLDDPALYLNRDLS